MVSVGEGVGGKLAVESAVAAGLGVGTLATGAVRWRPSQTPAPTLKRKATTSTAPNCNQRFKFNAALPLTERGPRRETLMEGRGAIKIDAACERADDALQHASLVTLRPHGHRHSVGWLRHSGPGLDSYRRANSRPNGSPNGGADGGSHGDPDCSTHGTSDCATYGATYGASHSRTDAYWGSGLPKRVRGTPYQHGPD